MPVSSEMVCSPPRNGRRELEQPQFLGHEGGNPWYLFFWAICYRICLLCFQFLCRSCLGAEMGSSPTGAAGGSCCPLVLCDCWPAGAVSPEKFGAHIWISRSQTFRMFCQKPQWFGRFFKLMPLLAFIDVRLNYFIYAVPCCMKECSECVRRRLCCLLLLM